MSDELLQKQIDEDRAAVLLGFTPAQLGLLCEQSGLGHRATGEDSRQRWFTYQELCQLCRWVARAAT